MAITPKLRKKYEKLILELRYLTADYDYHRIVYDDAQASFAEDFEAYREENSLITPEERILKTGEVNYDDEEEFTDLATVEEDQKKQRINAVTNLLFKKIAKETHPDKLVHMTEEEQDRREKMFIDAQDASEKREWFRLMCIATDLGIKLPTPTKEHLVLLEAKNKELRTTIDYMEKTYVWVYSKMPNDTSKRNVFAEFAKAVGYTTLD
jgi:DNA-binding ferritin-like protein